jgi:peptidoglycan/xylan/chitin deacetylase (PgdA/CDA1 family)
MTFYFFYMPTVKLPVLMYHRVTETEPVDYLTIRAEELDRQLQYLQEKGYTTVSAQQLIDCQYQGRPLPPKPVLLTFDDGYQDSFTLLYPMLVKYGMKATIFLVPSLVRLTGQSYPDQKFMTEEQIRQMDPAIVQFGLHSFDHSSYKEMTAAQISADIDQCKAFFERIRVAVRPILAYTFGAYPKTGEPWKALVQVLKEKDIRLAFRIGNRINRLPVKEPFVVQRIDIRGDETFRRFQRKLKWGGKPIPMF